MTILPAAGTQRDLRALMEASGQMDDRAENQIRDEHER